MDAIETPNIWSKIYLLNEALNTHTTHVNCNRFESNSLPQPEVSPIATWAACENHLALKQGTEQWLWSNGTVPQEH